MYAPITAIRYALARRFYLDTHAPNTSVLLAGTGRGGTTWLSQLINHDHHYRFMFEPAMPDHVPLFASLSRRPYLKRDDNNEAWEQAMDRVVAGRVRNRWVDAHNTKLIATRRLIKDIRLNLALPWISQRYPDMPIVWLLRHPCAVAHSKLKLGWETHLDLFFDDTRLMSDHLSPFRKLLTSATEPWDRHVLMWCVETLVPLKMLGAEEALAVCYEDLCDRPWEEMARVFAYLGQGYTSEALRNAITAQSASYRHDSAVLTGADRVTSWEQHVSQDQRRRADDILRAFGLDALYCAQDPRPRCEPGVVIGALRLAG